jgi:hypothetical protein
LAIKGKSTGRTARENEPAGLWQSRLRAGKATGLNRGVQKEISGKSTVILNKRKYTTDQFS